jgi:hypothetical protein
MKKRLIILFITLLATFCIAADLPTNSPPSAPPNPNGSKFLFVIDTSANMGKLDLANRQTLFDLIYLGVNGQIQHLDTFGLWTFNTKILAGEYPMQVYETDRLLELASRATFFLKSKKYTGKSEMDLLIVNLASLARTIKNVNFLILTDGTTPIHGTPFDDAINLAFKQRAEEQRKAEKPFIATFVVRDGNIIKTLVTLPGEDIEIPPVPVIAKVIPPAPAPKPAPQPLIIRATKPLPAEPAVTQPSETKPVAEASVTEPIKLIAIEPPPAHTETNAESAASVLSAAAVNPDQHTISQPAVHAAAAPSIVTAQEKPLGTPSPAMAVVTPKPLFSPKILIFAGIVFLGGAFAMLLYVLRRIHKMTEPSIITRSMERRP